MTEPQGVPYIPGRRRWTVSYRGEEIAKPLRRQMSSMVFWIMVIHGLVLDLLLPLLRFLGR
jgi:hypothetical protein